MEDNADQQGAVELPQVSTPQAAAMTAAVQARVAAQAEARESRRADAHAWAAAALMGVFPNAAGIDTALRAMTARACVALVAERCSFLHCLAPSSAFLYEFDVAPAAGHADLRGSIPRSPVETTASRFECSPTCNPISLLPSHGWPVAAHVFLHRLGDAEPVGILSAYRAEGRAFTPEDVLLLDAIADQVTLALIRKLSELPM